MAGGGSVDSTGSSLKWQLKIWLCFSFSTMLWTREGLSSGLGLTG